jgi:DEAD/DEAH box helicase domain-containing protein
LQLDDERWFGAGLDDAVRRLTLDDRLKARDGRMYWAGRDAPAPGVGLRTGSSVEYRLVGRDGTLIGTADDSRVFQVAHPGAIYLHRGRQWRVERLDLEGREAVLVEADDTDEYTQARTEIDISIVAEDDFVVLGGGMGHLGGVEVTNHVVAYQRKRIANNEVLEIVPLDLPPRTLSTRACWYTVPDATLEDTGVVPAQVLGTVHAAEHGLIGLLPLFAICDRWDVGGVSMADHPATGEPTIFVYDGFPGGAGIAELAFSEVHRHITATRDLVAACPCDDGCPSCVQSPKCGNWNEHLDKSGAVRLLQILSES